MGPFDRVLAHPFAVKGAKQHADLGFRSARSTLLCAKLSRMHHAVGHDLSKACLSSACAALLAPHTQRTAVYQRAAQPNPVPHGITWRVYAVRVCAEASLREQWPSGLQNPGQLHLARRLGFVTSESVAPTWTLRCARKPQGRMIATLFLILVVLKALLIRWL